MDSGPPRRRLRSKCRVVASSERARGGKKHSAIGQDGEEEESCRVATSGREGVLGRQEII